MIECFLKFGVCMLTLDRNAKQPGKACQKIRIRIIELGRTKLLFFPFCDENFQWQ